MNQILILLNKTFTYMFMMLLFQLRTEVFVCLDFEFCALSCKQHEQVSKSAKLTKSLEY